MKRFFFSALLALACSAFAQNPSLLSLQRFSLHFNSAYHFNPWDNYNEALATVTQEIRLNRFFVEPVGFYEKINGDFSVQAGLNYRLPEISPQLFLQFNGQYGAQNAGFEFYPDPAQISAPFRSPAFHQTLEFRFFSAGLGLLHHLPLTKKLRMQTHAGVDRYAATLELQWRHSRNAVGPLPEGEGEQLAAKLKDNAWGGQVGVALAWKAFGPFALLAGANYRFAKFKSFEGEAEYELSQRQKFKAELVEASNYFGVRVKEQPDPAQPAIFLSPLTFLTAPDENNRTPATINFSGFGLTAGLQMEF